MSLILSIAVYAVALWALGLTVCVAASGRLRMGEVVAAYPVALAIVACVPLLQVVFTFPFGWGSVGVLWLVAVLGAALVGIGVRGAPRRPTVDRGVLVPALWTVALVLATFALTVLALWAAGGRTLETVSQTWDAFFDTNAIRWGFETGDLAPSRIADFSRAEPVHAWYPTVFHSLGVLFMQLAGTDAVVASNVAAATLAGAIWPSTVAVGARLILGPSRIVTWGALILQWGFCGMPWAPLGWGVLWATTGAATLIPLAMAGFAATAGLSARGADRTTRWHGLGVLIAALGGILIYHPRVLVIAVMPLFALWLWLWAERFWRFRRTPGVQRWLSLGVLGVSLLGLLVVVLFVGRSSFKARKWPVDYALWEEVLRYLVNAPLGWLPQIITATLVVIGVTVVMRRSRWRWLVVLLAVAVVVDLVTAVTQGMTVFNGLTRFWYNDRHRTVVLPAFPALLVTLIAVRALLVGWRRRSYPTPARVRAALAGSAVAVIALGWVGATQYLTRSYSGAAEDPVTSLVSADERAFFKEVAAIVPARAKILNNPNDGSAFLYAYENRWPVFLIAGGVNGSTANGYALRLTMNKELPVLVCRRFIADDITYVLTGGRTYSGGVINPDPAPGMVVPDGFPILDKVTSGAGFTLWKVKGCPIL